MADHDHPFIGQPPEPVVLAAVTLKHRWSGAPQALHGKTLRVVYRVLAGGIVTRELVRVDDLAGNAIRGARKLIPGLRWDEEQEHGGREGKGRPVVLAGVAGPDDAEAALLSWLEDVGLLLGDDDG